MADIAGTKNDGGVVFGSQVLTITDRDGEDAEYIAENFSLEDPSNWIVRKNHVGVPNGQVGVDDVPTGSATLQLASGNTLLPKKYAVFTAIEVGGDSVNLIVAKVGQAQDANGETKVTIDVRMSLNS